MFGSLLARRILSILSVTLATTAFAQRPTLVFMTDFGLGDGAVAAMKGVAHGVSADLAMFDLTHEISPFDIWQGAFSTKPRATGPRGPSS